MVEQLNNCSIARNKTAEKFKAFYTVAEMKMLIF